MKLRTKVAVGATLGAAVLAGGGALAFAYFTSPSSTSGTGNASVGSAANWGLSVNAATGGPLYPGSGSETVGYTVTNNGSGNEAITTTSAALTVDGSGNVYNTTSNAFVPGCLATWFVVANHGPVVPDDVASGLTASGTVTITMNDANISQNACEGVTPQVTINVG